MDNSKLQERLISEHAENVERLTRIEGWCASLDKDLKDLNKKLFGNGQPGVLQTMDSRISYLEKNFWRVVGFVGSLTLIVNLILILHRLITGK